MELTAEELKKALSGRISKHSLSTSGNTVICTPFDDKGKTFIVTIHQARDGRALTKEETTFEGGAVKSFSSNITAKPATITIQEGQIPILADERLSHFEIGVRNGRICTTWSKEIAKKIDTNSKARRDRAGSPWSP